MNQASMMKSLWTICKPVLVLWPLTLQHHIHAQQQSPRIAERGYQFAFPRDYGSHPGFKIEWWYVTGHLKANGSQRFGFQATFFRIATESPGNRAPEASGYQDLHLAHMALMDMDTSTFLHQERLNRDKHAAHAREGDLDLKNGNWTLRRIQEDGPITFRLKGSILAEATLDLELQAAKPMTFFGENGYARKGEKDSAASYYMTFTRLKTHGKLQLKGITWEVTGWSWMDHEISSSQLSPNQAGWDWISLRLDDGRDLMAYRMRNPQGEADPFSTLAWIDQEGIAAHQPLTDTMWQIKRRWTSPTSGNTYPIEVQLNCPLPHQKGRWRATVVPLLDHQEMLGTVSGIPYWEGACDVFDPSGQRIGQGYMELTGYGDQNGLDAIK
jgi:predicted secreted hydrolase